VPSEICRCKHTKSSHTLGHGLCTGEGGKCRCITFRQDPKVSGLSGKLKDVSSALLELLDELNVRQGHDRRTNMSIWASADDYVAHGDVMEMFKRIEELKGKLLLGNWAGREPS
jgi:hypothetical protein